MSPTKTLRLSRLLCLNGFLVAIVACQQDRIPNVQLLQAVHEEDTTAARLAISNGADPNSIDETGRPAIWIAVAKANEAILKSLLEAGGSATATYEDIPALVLATSGNDCSEEIVRLLVQYGAEVEGRDPLMGMTPLMHAAASGRRDCVMTLLEFGALPTERDRAGQTTLHHAILGGDVSIVTKLLESGLDPNEPGGYGWAPLIAAALADRVDLIRILLRYGADPCLRDARGRLAEDVATSSESKSLLSCKSKIEEAS